MHEYEPLLIYIAKEGGLFGTFRSSTLQMAKMLHVPQQTISRKLREMELNGFVNRTAQHDGITITITTQGREVLRAHHEELKQLFTPRKSSIQGTVENGYGEGAYYVSQKPYQSQFQKKLGFKAFPGTLNIKVTKEEFALFLMYKHPVKIEGFTTKERTFGSLLCYPVKINGFEGAIVIPERTRHSENIIEVIAPLRLRDKLNKQKVTIE